MFILLESIASEEKASKREMLVTVDMRLLDIKEKRDLYGQGTDLFTTNPFTSVPCNLAL